MRTANTKLQSSAGEPAPLPCPPRFVIHEELTVRGAVARLFARSQDPPPTGRLTPADETRLFKRLHYCGLRMSRLWQHHARFTPSQRQRYLEWYERYSAIRDRIINANLGLVFEMLGRNRFKNVDLDELRSEGMLALLRSADTFDPWSGFRFSTYACNSILRSFARVAKIESKRSHLWAGRLEQQQDPGEWTQDKREEELALFTERLRAILADENSLLSKNELFVLQERFPVGPNEHKATLKNVGENLQVSKERVRQIQESALSKLRQLLHRDPVLQ